MKDYTKIYVIIFWSSLLSILLWVVLKVLGLINTPKIIELFPIISATFGAGAFFQMVLDMKNRLTKLEHNFVNLEKTVDRNDHSLDKRLCLIEKKV